MQFKLSLGLSGIMIYLCMIYPAYAYLDPGTGSAILQGIIGALAAIVVAVKLYWYRILRFLGLSKKRIDTEQATEKQTEEK